MERMKRLRALPKKLLVHNSLTRRWLTHVFAVIVVF